MKNDKKEKFKHNLVGWIATFAIAGGIAFATIGVNHVQKAIAEEEIPQLTQPLKSVIQLDIEENNPPQYDFYLSSYQLNNNTYTYLANQIIDNATSSDFENTYLMYNNVKYSFYEYEPYLYLSFYDDDEINSINFELRNNNTNYSKFIYIEFNGEDSYTIPFTNSVYFYNAEFIQNNLVYNGSGGLSNVLGDFVHVLVNGISDLASGVASGVANMAKDLFLVYDADTGVVSGLSTFGGIVAIFAGLALAIGITTKVYLWVTSLGN